MKCAETLLVTKCLKNESVYVDIGIRVTNSAEDEEYFYLYVNCISICFVLLYHIREFLKKYWYSNNLLVTTGFACQFRVSSIQYPVYSIISNIKAKSRRQISTKFHEIFRAVCQMIRPLSHRGHFGLIQSDCWLHHHKLKD